MGVKLQVKSLLKPTISKALIFLAIGAASVYFFKENVCAASIFFAFCYKSYGFPFNFIISGDSEIISSHIKTTFLGGHFMKSGSLLFNPLSLILDLALIYLLSCIVVALFSYLIYKKFPPH